MGISDRPGKLIQSMASNLRLGSHGAIQQFCLRQFRPHQVLVDLPKLAIDVI
jgi:hypothetical protein